MVAEMVVWKKVKVIGSGLFGFRIKVLSKRPEGLCLVKARVVNHSENG